MDFDKSIGYLIHEISQKLTAESDKLLQDNYKIGFSQYKVLLAIEVNHGMLQKNIARLLQQTEASVSRQVGILVDKDLVFIGPTEDSREHQIHLTSRGEDLVSKCSYALNHYHEPIFSNLNEKDLRVLRSALLQIQKNL